MNDQFLTVSREKTIQANRWFTECKHAGRPYVVVWRRRKYARVIWDAITTFNGRIEIPQEEALEKARNLWHLWRGMAEQHGARWCGDLDSGRA